MCCHKNRYAAPVEYAPGARRGCHSQQRDGCHRRGGLFRYMAGKMKNRTAPTAEDPTQVVAPEVEYGSQWPSDVKNEQVTAQELNGEEALEQPPHYDFDEKA